MNKEKLARLHKKEAVDVLTASFWNYPVMTYTLQDAGNRYEESLRAMVGFFCENRLIRNGPLLGLQVEEEVVAVACIDVPSEKAAPEDLHQEFAQLGKLIGSAAIARLERYETESIRFAPTAPHHFLGIIGVHPDHQKRGYARILLDEIYGMSASDPLSTGVCLNTEEASNVAFYRYFGYEVIGEADIDSIHTWCMFRANPR
ncbi:GNAT family N-acetyltransferase [bacterium]|nr:GNAT family N-acetyltransferase [bacterium]